MTVHLLTNASILASPHRFQSLVHQIHALGPALPLVEWTFIFLPLIFHAVLGLVIVKGGLPNSSTYSHSSNIRYTLQRATGVVAFFFIFWHIFHMHGWLHADWWLRFAEPLGGASFKPFNAASTAALALRSPLVLMLYAIGVLSCVYHLANGLWTMGITWGIWVSPAAQRRANWVAAAVGVGLTVVSMSALAGFGTMSDDDIRQAQEVEDAIYSQKVATGELEPDSHKRAHTNESGQTDDEEAHGAAPNRRHQEDREPRTPTETPSTITTGVVQ